MPKVFVFVFRRPPNFDVLPFEHHKPGPLCCLLFRCHHLRSRRRELKFGRNVLQALDEYHCYECVSQNELMSGIQLFPNKSYKDPLFPSVKGPPTTHYTLKRGRKREEFMTFKQQHSAPPDFSSKKNSQPSFQS